MKVPPINEITLYTFSDLDLSLNHGYIIRSYLSFVKLEFRLFSKTEWEVL